MNYTAFMIRKTRLEKNWSQDGLCKNICTASYLSKIEQGKAEPSDDIIQLLFNRLGICWHTQNLTATGIEDAYELLLSGELELLEKELENESVQAYENSPWGLDYLLLQNTVGHLGPVNPELETLMQPRQLALQRLLQSCWDEAIRLYPCCYTYYAVGLSCYKCGNYAKAIDFMNRANTLASDEGCVQIMMHARVTMGSCYSNLNDFESMNRHYAAAQRMARSLGDMEILDGIKYNIAATCLETGRYQEAYAYFKTKRDSENRLSLHKLAICCEKLGLISEALETLRRASVLPDDSTEQMESEMCRVVYLRLTEPRYLDSEQYGESLIKTFSLCRKNAPAGFCLFHMPWMLEWYEHHRQYKTVASLLMKFPEYSKKIDLSR